MTVIRPLSHLKNTDAGLQIEANRLGDEVRVAPQYNQADGTDDGSMCLQLRPNLEALAEETMMRLRQITSVRKGTQAMYASYVPARKPAATDAESGRPSLVSCIAGEADIPQFCNPPQACGEETCL